LPELKPSQVTVMVAKNEQHRASDSGVWDFTCKGARQESATLGISGADCTLRGFEHVLRVERKEVNDYIHSITNERERFERQMKYMRQFPFRAVIVEWPSLSTLLDGLGRHGRERIFRSKAHWNGVRGSTLHLSRRYCQIIFAGDRDEARDYAWDFMFGVAQDWWKTYGALMEPVGAEVPLK
jgi:hypothetical protein